PLRPGPDVGDDDQAHRGARRRGPARDAGYADRGLRRAGRSRAHRRRGHRASRHDLLADAARHGCHRRAEAASRRRRGGHRPAPLQQLGPLDAQRHARGRQPAARDRPRHLVGQRRVRLPRGADRRRRRAALPHGAGASLHAGAAGGRSRLTMTSARARALAVPATVSLVALAAVVWWAQRQDLPDLPSLGEAAGPLLAGLALYAFATLLRGERWYRVLALGGVEGTRADAYALTVVGYMGNNALPARAGDVIKAMLSASRAH